jgi:tRNA pseudouridine55 synthase
LPIVEDNATSTITTKVACSSPYLHPRQILNRFPSVTASPQVIAAIRNGRSINLPEFSDAPLVKVFADQQLLVAVAQRIAGTLFQPRVVLFGSNEPLPS